MAGLHKNDFIMASKTDDIFERLTLHQINLAQHCIFKNS
jgi:hypothetical protein